MWRPCTSLPFLGRLGLAGSSPSRCPGLEPPVQDRHGDNQEATEDVTCRILVDAPDEDARQHSDREGDGRDDDQSRHVAALHEPARKSWDQSKYEHESQEADLRPEARVHAIPT